MTRARAQLTHTLRACPHTNTQVGSDGVLTRVRTQVGGDGVARLADFGAARAVGRALRLPLEGAALLTLAPEMVRREAGWAAADVWALGCCVWEMATGAPLFTADAVFRMAQARP